jgi:hypothetical protein
VVPKLSAAERQIFTERSNTKCILDDQAVLPNVQTNYKIFYDVHSEPTTAPDTLIYGVRNIYLTQKWQILSCT